MSVIYCDFIASNVLYNYVLQLCSFELHRWLADLHDKWLIVLYSLERNRLCYIMIHSYVQYIWPVLCSGLYQ